jgi:uncharacterized protein (TIGR04255 family)
VGKELKNKPLVEAILELKWKLEKPAPNVYLDPHYKILLGRLQERIADDYPEPESLPAASMPDEIAPYIVRHRFRVAKMDWPLIQIGPGVMTLNETQKYTWPDFRERALAAVKKLFEAHPNPDELKIQDLMLRYIDAVETDYSSESILQFLKDKMQVQVSFPIDLFDQPDINKLPRHFRLESSFFCKNPKGIVNVTFATGEKNNEPALVWETLVKSSGEDVPPMPDKFKNWIDSAHQLTDDWFFKLIKGELERRFDSD